MGPDQIEKNVPIFFVTHMIKICIKQNGLYSNGYTYDSKKNWVVQNLQLSSWLVLDESFYKLASKGKSTTSTAYKNTYTL